MIVIGHGRLLWYKKRGEFSPRFYSFCHIMYRPAKSVDWCQCCMRGVTLTDAEGSADLLGNDDSAEIIDTSYNTGCLHISVLLIIILIRRIIPVAVPGIFVGGGAPASSADRCHSLSSLHPPPAALASLPCSFHISSLLVNSRMTVLVFVSQGDLYEEKNKTGLPDGSTICSPVFAVRI